MSQPLSPSRSIGTSPFRFASVRFPACGAPEMKPHGLPVPRDELPLDLVDCAIVVARLEERIQGRDALIEPEEARRIEVERAMVRVHSFESAQGFHGEKNGLPEDRLEDFTGHRLSSQHWLTSISSFHLLPTATIVAAGSLRFVRSRDVAFEHHRRSHRPSPGSSSRRLHT